MINNDRKVAQEYYTALVDFKREDGKKEFKADENGNLKADSFEPTLVKKNLETGKWEPVDTVDKELHRDNMKMLYGLWTDKEVTKTTGHLWWAKTEVVRPKDGKIDNDEISTFEPERLGNGIHGPNLYYLGTEMVLRGALPALHSQYMRFPDMLIIDSEIAKMIGQYTADDSNWQVKYPKS
ncbi:MAG: hypothetical protein AB9903_18265 [Vulcanimicrobiota bacterium]